MSVTNKEVLAGGQPPAPQPHALTPALLTRKQLAVYLARSLPALDRDRAAGMLPHPVVLGVGRRSPRWPRQEIDNWISAGCPTGSEWAALNADPRRRRTG